ncbi:spidroin-1-like [Argiope bruennichi]|uniref:spidroin-1-like n=1 Tax=Argiope bruennichi TaxID=94029 RepID=UPI0024957FBA|nr:spidroin-1-like [Argiope bruennichi]
MVQQAVQQLTSGGYGYGAGAAAGAGAGAAAGAGSYSGSINRLSSAEAVNRVSSNVGAFVSGGASALPGVISNIFSGVSASAGSYEEAVIQSLLEVVSVLLHILSNSSIGYVGPEGLEDSLAVVQQAVGPVVC